MRCCLSVYLYISKHVCICVSSVAHRRWSSYIHIYICRHRGIGEGADRWCAAVFIFIHTHICIYVSVVAHRRWSSYIIYAGIEASKEALIADALLSSEVHIGADSHMRICMYTYIYVCRHRGVGKGADRRCAAVFWGAPADPWLPPSTPDHTLSRVHGIRIGCMRLDWCEG